MSPLATHRSRQPRARSREPGRPFSRQVQRPTARRRRRVLMWSRVVRSPALLWRSRSGYIGYVATAGRPSWPRAAGQDLELVTEAAPWGRCAVPRQSAAGVLPADDIRASALADVRILRAPGGVGATERLAGGRYSMPGGSSEFRALESAVARPPGRPRRHNAWRQRMSAAFPAETSCPRRPPQAELGSLGPASGRAAGPRAAL